MTCTSRSNLQILRWLLILGAAGLLVGCVSHTGPTHEQMDAVLVELRAIRSQLATAAAPAAAAPKTAASATDARVSIAGAPVLGDKSAPLALVAYMDIECGFCRRFHLTTFPEIKRRFVDTGQLRVFVKDLPLPMHAQAVPAANALACTREIAGDDAYWKLYDALFANNTRLAADVYASMAQDVGVPRDRFESCMTARKDQAPGPPPAGITGTPSFVLGKLDGDTVNGKIIVGAQPFSSFEAAIVALQNTK